MVLTGQFGHLNGVPTNVEQLHSTTVTFPKLLQASGYQTTIIGKWHLKTLPEGFDHYEIVDDVGDYYNPTFTRPRDTVRVEGYATDLITDRVLEWLDKGRDRSRPFLMMYQHKAPHRPWQPGPGQLDLFRGISFPEPPTLFDDWAGRAPPAREQDMTIARHLDSIDLKLAPPGNLNASQRERWNAVYGPPNAAFREAALQDDASCAGSTSATSRTICVRSPRSTTTSDACLTYLDANGLAENTIVIYSIRPGLFPRRARLVRQALDVRGIAAHAADRALARRR